MNKETVLIVEDDLYPDGALIEKILKDEGYSVLKIAESAGEAFSLAVKHRPSVVVMDIQLPEGPYAGARMAREIQDETGAFIVFVTSANNEPQLFDTVRLTDDFQFLSKPVDKRQLVMSVQLGMSISRGREVVFVCYSQRDGKYAEELRRQVGTCADVGVGLWFDKRIRPGQRWKTEIKRALARSVAVVCLISADFLNSEFIRKEELPEIMRAATERELKVIPIYVGFVERRVLNKLGLDAFQGINRPEDPIGGWRNSATRDKRCWVPLCNELCRLFSKG